MAEQSISVLVVDDDPTELLRVTPVQEWPEALHHIEQYPVDIIIVKRDQSDRSMLEQVRGMLPHAPIIVFPANGPPGITEPLYEDATPFRIMFEQGAVGMTYVDLNGKFLFVNPQMCAITGYTQDELVTRLFSDLTTPEEAKADWVQIDRLLAGEIQSYTREKPYIHKSGKRLWVTVTVTLVRSNAGQPLYFMGVIQDITERKETEQKLAYMASIIDNSEDAIVSKTLDGIIVSWNAAAERMYGYAAEEIIGHSVMCLFPSERADEYEYVFSRVRNGEHLARFETTRLRKDGRAIDVALTVSPVLDKDGQVIGVSAIERDISERKWAENALAESEAKLRQITENIEQVLVLQDSHSNDVLYVSQSYETVWGRRIVDFYENPLDFFEIVHPEDRAWLLEVAANQTTKGADVEYRVIHPCGEERWVHAQTHPIKDEAGEVYRLAGIVEDITEYKRLVLAEREQRVLAEALRDTANALNSTLEMSEVLDRILANIERVVPHDAAEIMLIEDGIARIVRSRGYDGRGMADELAALEFDVRHTPNLHKMAHTHHPLIIPDIHRNPKEFSLRPSSALFWNSYAGVPIQLQHEVIGFINLGSVTPYFFTPVHADRLQAFAEQAATAIQNARLHEQVRELAVHEERQRLARDLHDAVSQTLFSASIMAEALARQWERHPERVGPRIAELHRLTRGALAETRAVLLELRPTALTEVAFDELLRQLVEATESRKRLKIHLDLDTPADLSADVKLALYRIVQEGLNNVIKHAQATTVTITLHQYDQALVLSIQDDGRGFDHAQIQPTSLGLGIMQERVQSIGAALDVQSTVGEGTRITVQWAVRKDATE